MKSSRRVVQTMAVALALAGSMATASASVSYKIGDGGLESGFNVSIDGSSFNNILAGGISIQQMGVVNTAMPTSYITVCTDIEGTLYLNRSYTYNTPVTPFSGQTGLNPQWGLGTTGPLVTAGDLAASEAAAIQNAAYLFYTYGQLTVGGLGGTAAQKAGLQLAVWDVLYDTVANGKVTGTRFSFSGSSADESAIDYANTWISGLDSMAKEGNFGYAGFLLYPDSSTLTADAKKNNNGEPPQELLIAVPESPSIIAGALLLLPLGASVFRILNKRRAV
jgi:hypothetical protein